MEYVSKNAFFFLEDDGEKLFRKNLFEIPPCLFSLTYYIKVTKIPNSVIKITIFLHGGISK
jgi:hypothetical protein